MISTTTNAIEGKRIVEYKGIVFGEVISGVNFVRDFAGNNMLMVSASGTAVVYTG